MLRCRAIVAVFALLLDGGVSDVHQEWSQSPCFRLQAPDGTDYTARELPDILRPWVALQGSKPLDNIPPVIKEGRLVEITDESKFCSVAMFATHLAREIAAGTDNKPQIWEVLLGLPWEQIVRHTFPVFELVELWTRPYALKNMDSFIETCVAKTYDIWNHPDVVATGQKLRKDLTEGETMFLEDEVLYKATETLLVHVKEPHIDAQGSCNHLLGILLSVLLSLAPVNPLLTPGFVFRALQLPVLSMGGSSETVLVMANAPWPVFPLLVLMAKREWVRFPELDGVPIISPPQSQEASGVAAASLPAFKPVDRRAHDQLEKTFGIAHTVFSLLGISYITIDGTLLGAQRHFDFIPWDDDVDVCVDVQHLYLLWCVIRAEAVQQFGLPSDSSWNIMRALAFLEESGHALTIESARSFTWRIAPFPPSEEDKYVDGWTCWGLEVPEPTFGGDIVLYSFQFGPRFPREHMFPRRKLPFRNLAVWGPAEPELVAERLFPNFRDECVGRHEHTAAGILDFSSTRIPCSQLASHHNFASAWAPLEADSSLRDSVNAALQKFVIVRLPGLQVISSGGVDAASPGEILRTQMELYGAGRPGEPLQFYLCEAYLWNLGAERVARGRWNLGAERVARGRFLDVGALPGGLLKLRSFVCYRSGEEWSSYVWEDSWL